MDSKLFSKCRILAEVYKRYANNSLWSPFFEIYDLALPLAHCVVYDCATPTDQGEKFLEDAWLDLCRIVMVDSEEEYDLLDEMLVIGAMEDES